MIPLGLTAAQQTALHATLVDHHSIHVTITLLNLAGAKLSDLTWRLLDGQVNVDADAEITRSCTLSLLDPNRSVTLDSDSPDDAAMYVDRMIQVNYSVKAATTGATWVTIPVFTGPITKLDRDDAVINVECQGKELLGLGQVWTPRTYPKGWRKVDMIQSVLADRAGETKFSFPEYTAQLPTDYAINMTNTPWGVAKHVATGMGLQLFYDGRGVCRLRARPQSSVFRFKQGDGGSILTTPKITYTVDDLKNVVYVRGANAVRATATAQASHPLSPVKLGRNGVPRYLLEVYENNTIESPSVAIQYAKSILASKLLQSVDVAFDAFPLPHLEETDVCRFDTDQASSVFRATKFSIPLTAGGAMSIGYLKRLGVYPLRPVVTSHRGVRSGAWGYRRWARS